MRDKRVYVGRDKNDEKVIIKISNSYGGMEEIKSEKRAQDTLSNVTFSQEKILFPEEILYKESPQHTIRITKFIDQEKVFSAYSSEEKFFMIIKELETEEAFYANTYEHIGVVKNIFPVSHATDYIRSLKSFEVGPKKGDALKLLEKNVDLIETRSNYLTHTDFVPSNFRVSGGHLYMIDLSSMHFANRYEGLARFLNWCIIHDLKLEELITEYIKKNRGEEELLCLRLMRIYKAGFLINHYKNTLNKTQGDLHILNQKRLDLWQYFLECLLDNKSIDQSMVEKYRTERNDLRSTGEVERQKEFNIPTL